MSTESAERKFAELVAELGLDATTPLICTDSRGIEHRGLAFLRHFGSKGGIVVGPFVPATRFQDPFLGTHAKAIGATYSTVNVDLVLSRGREFLIECLVDWGYHGPPPKPPFLPEPPWGV